MKCLKSVSSLNWDRVQIQEFSSAHRKFIVNGSEKTLLWMKSYEFGVTNDMITLFQNFGWYQTKHFNWAFREETQTFYNFFLTEKSIKTIIELWIKRNDYPNPISSFYHRRRKWSSKWIWGEIMINQSSHTKAFIKHSAYIPHYRPHVRPAKCNVSRSFLWTKFFQSIN